MKGKVVGTYLSTFKDGSVSGRVCVQVDKGDNLNGIRVDTVNVSLDNLPVKHINELIGKDVIVTDNGYPKYTWANEIYLV